jgi:hypothetical protein
VMCPPTCPWPPLWVPPDPMKSMHFELSSTLKCMLMILLLLQCIFIGKCTPKVLSGLDTVNPVVKSGFCMEVQKEVLSQVIQETVHKKCKPWRMSSFGIAPSNQILHISWCKTSTHMWLMDWKWSSGKFTLLAFHSSMNPQLDPQIGYHGVKKVQFLG